MPSLTTTLEDAVRRAIGFATERRHEIATLEHLLLALIDEPDASNVMQGCAVDLHKLRTILTRFIDDEPEASIFLQHIESAPSPAFQRVIQRAAIHVQSAGLNEVTGANVLVAIFNERESHAAFFLQEQDMTRYDAVNYLTHGVAKDPTFHERRANSQHQGTQRRKEVERTETPVRSWTYIYDGKTRSTAPLVTQTRVGTNLQRSNICFWHSSTNLTQPR